MHEHVGEDGDHGSGNQGGYDAEGENRGKDPLEVSQIYLYCGGEEQETEHVVEKEVRKVFEEAAKSLHGKVDSQLRDVAEDEEDEGQEDGAEGHGDGGGDAEEVEIEDAENDGGGKEDDDDVCKVELGHEALDFLLGAMVDGGFEGGGRGGYVGGGERKEGGGR